jgi:hypothetical protein
VAHITGGRTKCGGLAQRLTHQILEAHMVYVHAVRDYLWTDDLNTSFWQQYRVEGKAKDVAEAIELIRRLTGWPWHVCRTQATLLGLIKRRMHHEWTSELDDILELGYQEGGRAKQEAIARIQAATGWPRQACYDRARKLGLGAGRRRWTEEEDKYLLDFVGSKNLREIAKRLKRTVAAARMRLSQLGGQKVQCQSHRRTHEVRTGSIPWLQSKDDPTMDRRRPPDGTL